MQTEVTALTQTVGDAMTHGVINCPPETPLRLVARMMATHRVHAVVVHGTTAYGSHEWGVVSDLDLVAAAPHDFDRRTAGTAASSPALTVTPDETLERVAQLMAENETAHVIVVDAPGGRPVGVVSTLDLARVLATEQGRNDYGPTS
jgi:CBS domain-containing protein